MRQQGGDLVEGQFRLGLRLGDLLVVLGTCTACTAQRTKAVTAVVADNESAKLRVEVALHLGACPTAPLAKLLRRCRPLRHLAAQAGLADCEGDLLDVREAEGDVFHRAQPIKRELVVLLGFHLDALAVLEVDHPKLLGRGEDQVGGAELAVRRPRRDVDAHLDEEGVGHTGDGQLVDDLLRVITRDRHGVEHIACEAAVLHRLRCGHAAGRGINESAATVAVADHRQLQQIVRGGALAGVAAGLALQPSGRIGRGAVEVDLGLAGAEGRMGGHD